MAMVENTIEKTLIDEVIAVAKAGDAKSAVQHAIESPDLFHFGEILNVDDIKNLKTTDESAYKTLELFAYGHYDQYIHDPSAYLTLNDQCIRKLRQLTLLDIIAESTNSYISYDVLTAKLGIQSIVVLESLIIDAAYRNLLRVRFDSAECKALLTGCVGRDLHPVSGLNNAVERLNEFIDRCNSVLGDVDQHMRQGNERAFDQLQKKQRVQEEYRGVKAALEQSETALDVSVTSSRLNECPSSPSSRATARSQLNKRLKGHGGNSQSPTAKNQTGSSVSTWLTSGKINVANMFRRNASNERNKEPSSSLMNGN